MEAVTGAGAAVPSYLLTTAEAPPPEEDGDEGGLEDILQVFKIFKLARVLKLARHSPGLQVSTASRAFSLLKALFSAFTIKNLRDTML